jgi:hypothetical protein
MQKIEDRIALLWTRCSVREPFNYNIPAWSHLKEGIKLRNSLTHPRQATALTVDEVSRSIGAIIEIIDIAYTRVYGKPLPAKNRGLQSSLSF